jgi:hypothetical protein
MQSQLIKITIIKIIDENGKETFNTVIEKSGPLACTVTEHSIGTKEDALKSISAQI